ncbi:MAG: RNA polymerase sporulation sigma factor SigK [Clostridia bacterium]|nr:RNA polymerase sporulation sigma factor SigK [Clostridia bacterium]
MIFESIGAFLTKLTFFYAYVDNKSSFPKPLNKDEENDLVAKMSAGDKDAKIRLIEHNMRLVAHIVKKYSSTAEADDLISAGSIGLIKALNSYNLEKGASLSTYAARCIENEILMLLRANKKHISVDSLDETLGTDSDDNDVSLMDTIPQNDEDGVFFKVNNSLLMETIDNIMKQKLNQREYFVVKYRYGLGGSPAYTQREVAEMLDISRSYISRIEKKALSILRAYLDKDVCLE